MVTSPKRYATDLTDEQWETVRPFVVKRMGRPPTVDRGYVTVTPDYEFRVSRRLREDYDNGKVYYQNDGQTIWTPGAPYPKPDPERLEGHATKRFLDA